MTNNILFLFNSAMLGVGLAMDAFSVSLANGFAEPRMNKRRRVEIAMVYAIFQFAMPVIGWFFVHNATLLFRGFQRFIPWIALILLAIIGGKMLREGIDEKKCKNDNRCDKCDRKSCSKFGSDPESTQLTFKVLMVQGIATSIDALSVGFTIANYKTLMVLICGLIIAVVTYILCYIGLKLGIKFGTKLAGNAKIIGGIILIAIGLEIFFS